MIVYVAINTWDTPDTEGAEILGVFSSMEAAREVIEASAEKIRAEYDADLWDEDMTWDEPESIHLGGYSLGSFEPATLYSWEIVKRTLDEQPEK